MTARFAKPALDRLALALPQDRPQERAGAQTREALEQLLLRQVELAAPDLLDPSVKQRQAPRFVGDMKQDVDLGPRQAEIRRCANSEQ